MECLISGMLFLLPGNLVNWHGDYASVKDANPLKPVGHDAVLLEEKYLARLERIVTGFTCPDPHCLFNRKYKYFSVADFSGIG